MIYSKTIHETEIFKDIKNLKLWNNDINSVFWYDQHDQHQRGIDFENFIDSKHWEYLKENLNSKILIFYGDEYFNLNDIGNWIKTIKKLSINTSQIYLIAIDKNYARWAEERFLESDIRGINICSFNELLRKTKIISPSNNLTTYKFSAFSRNYNIWRLNLFANLYKKNLLENFNYTFNNVNPYSNPVEIISHSEILSDLLKLKHNPEEFNEWVKKIPYTLKENSFKNKWDDKIYEMILNSDIHLLVESHYDPYRHFWNYEKIVKPNIFSPAFYTEKTYKVIMCQKPFIAFSTPYFMKEMENLGFKTFSKYIDESYDSIENNDLRLKTIVSEIERISSLNKKNYHNLLIGCKEICYWNYRRLLILKNKIKFDGNFDWINQYVSLNYRYNF